MEFIYTDQDYYKERNKNIIANINEENISTYFFNEDVFYYIGNGHSFLYGFYKCFFTKSGIEGLMFSNFWTINNKDYKYDNEKFIEISKLPIEINNVSFKDIKLPLVKNINSKLLADNIQSVNPKISD